VPRDHWGRWWGGEKGKEKRVKGLDGTRFVQGREREGNDEVSKYCKQSTRTRLG
jgi:hypothetical protein